MTEENNKKKPFTLFNNETGQSVELPVLTGTDGPDVLDIRNLYKDTGLFTYDPGYTSTASCNSAITFIDGNKGIPKVENLIFLSSIKLLISFFKLSICQFSILSIK